MGTLNVTAMQIAVQESVNQALLFVLGSLTVEMIYVRISLVGIQWIQRQEKLMKMMQWITLIIILALAVGSFVAAAHPSNQAKNLVLQNNIPVSYTHLDVYKRQVFFCRRDEWPIVQCHL